MRKLPLASLALSSLFLLGCMGCCTGFTEGFTQSFNQSFDVSFRQSFVDSCAPEVDGMPPAEARRTCGCMADFMLTQYSATELLKLSAETDSPEFQKVMEQAAVGCVGK